jgi:hypothetical protein
VEHYAEARYSASGDAKGAMTPKSVQAFNSSEMSIVRL